MPQFFMSRGESHFTIVSAMELVTTLFLFYIHVLNHQVVNTNRHVNTIHIQSGIQKKVLIIGLQRLSLNSEERGGRD